MHNLILSRGHVEWSEKFFRELAANYVDFKMYDPETKKLEPKILQIRVSPVQLWDISFPKSQRDVVLSTIFPGGEPTIGGRRVESFFAPLRLALGLKKTAPFDRTKGRLRMCPPQHVELLSIGEKEDLWTEPNGARVKEKDKSDLAYEGI